MKVRGRYADFAHTAAIARALLADLDRQELDGILFTGDLTGLALPSEFAAARDALGPLLDDQRVLGIPGNHDVYTPGAVRDDLFGAHFGTWMRSDDPTRSLPIVRRFGDDATLVAVQDVRACWPHDSSGYLPPAQVAALREIAADRDLVRGVRILAMHYCVRMPDGQRDGYFHRLRNDEAVLALAAELGFELIVCGHVHHRSVHRAGSATPVALANPGSVSHGRRGRAYHVYTIEAGTVRLATRRYRDDSGSFEAWDGAPGDGLLVGGGE
jgi:3',5'-cyclic AMP phosphodiesterase CpdA